MYRILDESGNVVGYADDIRWIKKSNNGAFTQCDAPEAKGIAYKGTPYSLDAKGGLDGAQDVVKVEQVSAADEMFKNTQDVEMTQDGLMETYEATEVNASNIDMTNEAIMELYELVTGGE